MVVSIILAVLLALPTGVGPDRSSGGSISRFDEAPSASNVYNHIDILQDWYRYLDTSGHREAESYIEGELNSLGLNVTVQDYIAQRRDGAVRAANILGYLEGKDPTRCLVIGGHYDAQMYNTHGAYDNAVGVGCVLELARIFAVEAPEIPPISMLFATWDAEEGGGAGSNHFLNNMPYDTEIVAYINLDMFGLNYPVSNNIPMATEEYFKLNLYTSPVDNFSRYGTIEFSEPTLENFTAFRDTLENITYEQNDYPPNWVIVMDDTIGISDHRFFIEHSIPAVWLRGMNEKPRDEGDFNEIAFKHTPADTLETMERYAGGKSELLRGIDTGLGISYDLVNQWLDRCNSTYSVDIVGPPAETDEGAVSGGAVIGISFLALLIVPVVFIIWKMRSNKRSHDPSTS